MVINLRKYPITWIFGILVILIYCIFTFTAASLFTKSWSPLNTWLSDFGNSNMDYNPKGAIFFNIGCIITGITLIPFYIGLYKWFSRIDLKWKKIWIRLFVIIIQIIGSFSGFTLIMIGVFSEDFMEAHIFWSNIFFLLNLGVLILIGFALIIHEKFKKIIAFYGWIVALVNISFLWFHTPLLEWFTVFTALGLAALIAYNSYIAFKE
ncbi:MAG: DUF998 domain-containing protein [Candidatus Lokiarchaeota archaeon]|nr:DUF998 domain-containing protein [Candidatus Lokiarchaeota archaeon]